MHNTLCHLIYWIIYFHTFCCLFNYVKIKRKPTSSIVKRVIFAPCYFHSSSHPNCFAPSWIRSGKVVFLKKRYFGIRPVLILRSDDEGERGGNKTGQRFPSKTVPFLFAQLKKTLRVSYFFPPFTLFILILFKIITTDQPFAHWVECFKK